MLFELADPTSLLFQAADKANAWTTLAKALIGFYGGAAGASVHTFFVVKSPTEGYRVTVNCETPIVTLTPLDR